MAAVVSALGCAGYGWADRSPSGDADFPTTLRVESPVAPAHLGVNRSELEQLLRQQLEFAGIAATAQPAASALRCSIVDPRVTGFGTELYADLTVVCDVVATEGESPAFTASARGIAFDRLRPDAALSQAAMDGSRRVLRRATADAFEQIAVALREHLDTEASP